MSYPVDCQRIRLGGTVSGSTITGGTTLQDYGINFAVFDGFLGWAGRRGGTPEVPYRHGYQSPGRRFYPARVLTAQLWWNYRDTGDVDGGDLQLEANHDALLGLLHDQQALILENDMADGTTRFLEVEALDAWPITGGPLRRSRRAGVLLRTPWPFWQGKVLNSQAVVGADSVANAGNAPAVPVLTFTGGTDTKIAMGTDYVQVAGAATVGGVEVDCRARTVTDLTGSTAYDSALAVASGWWLELEPGANAVTVTGGGTVTVEWRDSWF